MLMKDVVNYAHAWCHIKQGIWQVAISNKNAIDAVIL